MGDTTNPFIGMSDAAHQVVERLLSDLYKGGEWQDEHEDLLDQWRDARGEDAKTDWHWWAGDVDNDVYSFDAATRDEVIAMGRREFRSDGKFRIVEARLWSDFIKDGADVCDFAETRNYAVIPVADNDPEAADG